MYHSKCYKRYIRPIYNAEGDENVGTATIKEVKQLFLNHVATVVFNDGEPRTLKQLLKEYEDMLQEYGCGKTSMRSTDIEVLLEECFGDAI